jgi:hypothetical protein
VYTPRQGKSGFTFWALKPVAARTFYLCINVWAAYPFCLLPVFFPDALWLGFAMVLFGVGQFVVHGVWMNRKLRSLYNPGFATVVFGFLPLGLWYLFEVYSRQTVPLWNWALAVVYMMFFSGVGDAAHRLQDSRCQRLAVSIHSRAV